ncbi:CHAT domain-containing protein [Mycolicibacterium goodii]|uniref:CHAT domain-containing protein n=1 Tax=Mycolicibacterium goodii TaxID=134601 RepID=UPI001BDC73E4|nr:CHAT domain-containing protein [Mycolicibacterium goodii]MBU8817758.1 CHAT domain-containing protein [Mycolicibacterium goodii]
MDITLRINGHLDEADTRAARAEERGDHADPARSALLDAVEQVASYDMSPSARSQSAQPEHLSVDQRAILEIQVEGGFTTWTSAERYYEDSSLLNPESVVGDAVSVDALPRVGQRGLESFLISRLRVLRLKTDEIATTLADPARWPVDLVEEAKGLGYDLLTEAPAWYLTKTLIRLIEKDLRPGLYTWTDATDNATDPQNRPAPVDLHNGFDVDKPILVFIHGTASSTRGSFGQLLADDAHPQWQVLQRVFDDRIYAFEHRTLSESPIDNAIALVKALPNNARVSIVSHSRGGLVGDLISLKSIDSDLIASFTRRTRELEPADRHDRRQLGLLAELIAHKQLRIERFVRCASPSRGTLLAGQNLDTFLSVLTNLIGLIPPVGGTPLYEVIKRVTLEIVRNRTEPSRVPGLEAMMPGSPLVALLNNLTAQGAMGVIAGDIEGGNLLKRIGVFASDQIIYGSRDNDLVVNTDSMFHGAGRALSGYVFDQGSDVSHFAYFRNPRTRGALTEWLVAADGTWPSTFRKIDPGVLEPVPMQRSPQARTTADRPIVLVLPGIMGSELSVGEREVWMRYLALLRGGLGDLGDVAAANVRAVSLVGDGYRELCEFLQSSHEVIPFAYDWRRSVTAAARLLAAEVESALRRTPKPVRIIAHSMGGLVVRAMIAQFPELWDRICERDGGRLVMLGTPNRGSHDIVESLLGTDATVQKLAMLDLTHSTREVVEIIAGFPGVLELLPHDEQYFTASHWQVNLAVETSAAPAAALLEDARRTRDTLKEHLRAFPHADRVHYVAGTSPRTVTGVDVKDHRVVLTCTTAGDGRVTYASGRLPGVRTWYVDAVHGDLASHPPSFPALQDLLESGTTSRLATDPIGGARGDVLYPAFPEPVMYPARTSLAADLLGKPVRAPYRQGAQPSFLVSVLHDDLRYARHPIVVGHYEGDTIIGAEAQLDGLLRGALTERYALGLYPGAFGSVAVVLRKPTPVQQALALPSGTVVVGLGKWGELSAAQLSDLLRRAVLQYVLERRDGAPDDDQTTEKIGLSVLLVGGNSATNIAVGDSVGAILRAIAQANRELAEGDPKALTIREVEIVELYADTAIEAAHAVKRLAPLIEAELGTRIEVTPLLRKGREGRRRLTSSAGRQHAWRRWEVSVVDPPRRPESPCLPAPLADRLKRAVLESGSADPELVAALAELAIRAPAERDGSHREIRFLTLSDRARAEATTQQRQPELVERLIKDSISQTRFRAEESRVLFELTVPNELKSGLAQVDNLVLVLDAESAAYPWELMSAGDKALCLEKGLVRQLQTTRYRPQIGARAGTAAYVVGDPAVSPPFGQLPGASAEAAAVYDLLRARFDVDEPVDRPTALHVLAGLYKKPYRIVHLAGHGHYEAPTTADGKARSGMVLDNGVFLTAVEIGQMQQVPELVFLNCCHIGQTGPDETRRVEFNRLAASVSRELIEMGVRAVVAAGWAVQDDAAKEFATKFYERMLAGEAFGHALKEARSHTHTNFEHSNTWGAYQAYGDPDYRLDPSATGTMSPGLGQVDVAEFIDAVDAVGRTAATPMRTAPASENPVQTLDALVRDCPPDWLAQTDVQMAVGYAYGSLEQFETAGRYLESALAGDGETSTTTMRAVEQLANFEARLADELVTTAPARAEKLYQQATERLERLLEVAKTAQRYTLLGSIYKRRAAAEATAAKARRLLSRALDHYHQAHVLTLQREGIDPYAALNWLTLATILNQPVPEADSLIDRCETAARERFSADRRFFTALTVADAALVRALRSGRLAQNGQAGDREITQLRARFDEVVELAAPTSGHPESVCTHIGLTSRIVRTILPRNANQMIADNLDELRRRIRCDQRNGQRTEVR